MNFLTYLLSKLWDYFKREWVWLLLLFVPLFVLPFLSLSKLLTFSLAGVWGILVTIIWDEYREYKREYKRLRGV